jgi:hypothetical protein
VGDQRSATALALFGLAIESQTARRRVGFVLLATGLNVLIFSTVTTRP